MPWKPRTLSPSASKLIELGHDIAPELWAAAIKTQWERVQDASSAASLEWREGKGVSDAPTAAQRLRYESHFLVVAIRHVLRVHDVFLELTGDQRLIEARQQFDAAIPHAKDFRDVLEHIDDYALDRGLLQQRGVVGKSPVLQTIGLLHNRERVRLCFDNYGLDLGAATRAALELAEAAAQVWSDHVTSGLHDWTDRAPDTQ